MKKLSNRLLAFLILSFYGFTFSASAQGGATQATDAFGSLKTVINSFSENVLTALGTLFMGAAVVIFFLGIVQYIWGLRSGDAGKAKVGSNFMLWGLVGLFVMFSVYGIVKWGQDIFFKGQNITTITIPSIKFNTSGGGTSSGPSDNICVTLPKGTTCAGACPLSGGGTGFCNAAGECCRLKP